MKCAFYIDTYPGMKPEYIFPAAVPGKKYEGQIRYKVTFELPDPNDLEVDEIIAGDVEA